MPLTMRHGRRSSPKASLWLALTVYTLGLAPRVWAFSVQPGFRVATVKPGKTTTVTYELVNDQDKPLTLHTKVRDSFVLPENKAFSASSWVEPPFKEITIPAHKTEIVKVKVRAPEKASGELAAFVTFIPQNPSELKVNKPQDVHTGIETRIVTMISASVYVRVQGTEKGESDVTGLGVRNLKAATDAPASIEGSLIVKNTGNVHQRPSGRFEIFKKGSKDAVAQMNFQAGWPSMPQAETSYTAKTEGTLPPGDYIVKARVTFEPSTVFIEKEQSVTIQ